jgi:radical SAM protein with 4Fe4S-binding SPASM domain
MVGLNLAGSLASRVIADAMSIYRGSFPHTVRVETTNHCQAACTFCPRDTIGRPKTFMKQELFEKVAMECAAGGCKLMHLHGFGEPLLDKQLPDRIMLCKRLGIPRVKIFTNGDLLRGDMAKRLLESMVDEVKISIDGSDSAEFNRLRVGLDFDKVLENVKEFRALRDSVGMEKPQIVATTCQTSNREQTEAMLNGVVDRIAFTNIHNWGGAMGMLTGQRIRKPCDRLWRTLTVLVNGDVALCCLDYSGKIVLGNANDEKITDIWSNEQYRNYRRLHRASRQEEIPLCSNCSKCFF